MKFVTSSKNTLGAHIEIAQTITRRITSLTGIHRAGQRSEIIGWQARCYHCHSDPAFPYDDYDNAAEWIYHHVCFVPQKSPQTPKKSVHHSNLHSGITGQSAR